MPDQTAPVLGFRFESALLYAYELHRGQTRKGGNIPYIGHLLLITLADKLHNARTLRADHAQHGDSIWSRVNQTDKLKQEWYYRGLLKIFESLATRAALGVAGPVLVTELTLIVTAIFG